MTIKYLVISLCLFCSISLMSQIPSHGIQEKEPIIKINIDPVSIYKKTTQSRQSTIQLPFEQLGYGEFEVKEDNILQEDFAKKYPEYKTYVIKSTKDKSVKGRMFLTPEASYATIMTPQGLASFYPKNGAYYLEEGIHFDPRQGAICTESKKEAKLNGFEKELNSMHSDSRVTFTNGGIRRTYNVAIVCTGEYYAANGNSDTPVRTSIIGTVNALNVIYENELSVILNLLEPEMYSNPATDPFIPDNAGGDGRVTQAINIVGMNFNSNMYDIGHVFHRHEEGDGWSNGGLARLKSACNNNPSGSGVVKAGGWSGAFNNVGNGWISLTAHEFGHMFGAQHTFNGDGESCSDAIGETSAFEIGSGTTIMSYNGLCFPAQNITGGGESDNYFHVHSIFQMISHINVAGNCAAQLPLNNSAPIVAAKPCAGDIIIPRNTPFRLTGSATDAEDDNLTFTWEQYDEDGTGSTTQGFIGTTASNSAVAPLFRSFAPGPSPTRYFPQLNTLINGANSDDFEVLPNRARTMHFQLTARDNNEVGGSITSNELEVTVDNSGPLSLASIPSVEAGTPFMVNWALNGTEALCNEADILLSIDGGLTFTIPLAEGVDYSAGSVEVTLPASFPNSDQGRIMLTCADAECYAFFDINNSDFDIMSSCLAGRSIICDSEYEEFDQGDDALNLDLIHIDGNPVSSISAIVTNDFASSGPLVFNLSSGGCVESFNYFTQKKTIAIDKTGSYTFNFDLGVQGARSIFSIFEAATYDEDNPCPSFVGSSATTDVAGGSFSSSSSITLPLERCKEYLIVFSNSAGQGELPKLALVNSISGPGVIIEVEEAPNPDYNHTFIAVNDAGVIEVVTPDADFTGAGGGLYDIYTVTYKASGATPPEIATPSSWLGVSLTDVQSMDCILLSINKKQILVDFTCRINTIETGMQSDCDPITNTYSQEIIITYDEPPLSGTLIVNGTPFLITGSPQSVTLVGQIADGASNGVSASFSEIPSCAKFIEDLYMAPENCCPITLDLGEDREVCDNQEVILDAGSDGTEYSWFRDAVELPNTASTLEVTVSGFYMVEVVNADGCSKFDMVDIMLNPSPIVELEEDISVCEGEIYIIQANTTAPDLKWFKDDVEVMGETDASFLVTMAGTYVLVGTNEFDCVEMDTIVIDYVTRPIVDLGDDQQFCEGDPVSVLDAGMDGTQYTWSKDNTVILTETERTFEVSESGQYSVVVDKGGGCDASDTIVVEFFNLAEVVAGNDINVCQGSSAELLSFIQADSYEWYFNGTLFTDQSESPEVTEEGEYVLVGMNEIGCESFDTVIVTEVVPPEVDLGDDRVGCIGSDITLMVDSIGLIFWIKDGLFFSSNATVTITEPGEYIASIIAASDCTGRDTIMVTFEPGPTLELGDDIGFCMGESDVINAATDGDNITWFLNDAEINGETDFELSVSEGGVYKAVVTGNGNCEVEDFVTVTVNEVPNLVLGDDEVICDGESVMLMTDFGAVSYDWQFEGMSISDQPSVEVSDAGIYTLTVMNEFGCSDSDEIEVNSNATPTLTLEDSYSICEGDEVDVIAMSDANSFQWFVDGVEQTEVTGNTITINAESMLEVTASSADGCTTDGSTQVVSVSSPTIELGNDFSLCPNESFVLNAGSHESYMWSNGQETSTINIVSVNPEMGTQETYAVTVTNEAGCSAEDAILVDFFPVVIGEIVASASGVCDGEPVQLTASGGSTYEWVDPNGTLTEIEGPLALASPTEDTQYSVLIRDAVCPDNIDIVEIDIEVFMAAEDLSAGEDDCAVNGSTLELNATAGIEYEWEDNGTIVSGADSANPVVSPLVDTTYFVNITDENGCIYRDSVNVCVLEDPLENFKLVSIITPNGDGDNDELRFEGLEAFPDNNLKIYNRWGYPVFERKRYQSDTELWNGENGGDILPADTYYYILTFDGKTYKSDITIMR